MRWMLGLFQIGKLVAIDENWSAAVVSDELLSAITRQLSAPPAM